jgi:hypothetical protein
MYNLVMRTHQQIIDLWDNRAQFARDVNVDYQTARRWYKSNSIPGKYWLSVEDAAVRRNFPEVSVRSLAEFKSIEIVNTA